MNEYKTSVYEKSLKKTIKRSFYNLAIIAAFCGVIYMFTIGLLGIELTVFGVISLIVGLIQLKNYDDKYMGITAYGFRKESLVINEEYLIRGDSKIPLTNLNDLVISVNEYEGMSRDFIGIHHGGNNKITYNYLGQKVSINYIIKTEYDFKRVLDLVKRIENKQRTTQT